MLSYFQILILALIQGACELLPVSSSAHVIAAEKLMGLDPVQPRNDDASGHAAHRHDVRRDRLFLERLEARLLCLARPVQWFAVQVIGATICTGVVGYGLKILIEKVFMRGAARGGRKSVFTICR